MDNWEYTKVISRSTVFWNVTPCSLVMFYIISMNQLHHLKDRKMEMEAESLSERLVNAHQATWCSKFIFLEEGAGINTENAKNNFNCVIEGTIRVCTL
jgi:hypothetical protein